MSSCVNDWANTKASMTCQNCRKHFFPRCFKKKNFLGLRTFSEQICWTFFELLSRSFDLQAAAPIVTDIQQFFSSLLLFKLKRLWVIESKSFQTLFGFGLPQPPFVCVHPYILLYFCFCQPSLFCSNGLFSFFVHLICRRWINCWKNYWSRSNNLYQNPLCFTK